MARFRYIPISELDQEDDQDGLRLNTAALAKMKGMALHPVGGKWRLIRNTGTLFAEGTLVEMAQKLGMTRALVHR